jgi:hypothetical protein
LRDSSRYDTVVLYEEFTRYPITDKEYAAILNNEFSMEFKHQENINLNKYTVVTDLIIINDNDEEQTDPSTALLCRVF